MRFSCFALAAVTVHEMATVTEGEWATRLGDSTSLQASPASLHSRGSQWCLYERGHL